MRTLSSVRFLIYLGWLLAGIFLWFLIKGQCLANPLIFSFGFLYILLLPGWLIGHIIKFQSSELSFKLLVYFLLSLGFYLFFTFLAIFLGLNITVLANILLILMAILFVVSLIHDLMTSKEQIAVKLEIKKYFKLENLFFLMPLALAIFTLWLVYLKQAGLNGDPYFHLAIINKVVDGDSLSSRSLALTKTQIINPAYVYPIWHIFVGFVSKIFAVDIFTTWSNILYVLTIFTFFTWYYLGKIIFQKQSWAILALTIMMIFTLYSGPGYFFTRLGVPDTLGQFILLPLGWIFAFSYIFMKEKENNLLLILNILIAFIILVVHGPHYFYLILSILIYGLIYALTHFKDPDYKETLAKVAKVFLADLLILILAGLIIELSSKTLSTAIASFYKSDGGLKFSTSFFKFGPSFRYSYFLLPILLLFYHSKRILFLISVMLITPIVFWTPLKSIFNKILSGVFTSRVRDNTTLYFLVFAFIFGLIFVLVDRLLVRLPKRIHQLFEAILGLLLILILIMEISSQAVSDFVNKVFYSKTTDVFVNNHYLWFLGGFLLLALLIYLIKIFYDQKRCRLDYQDNLTIFGLTLILAFVLFSPIMVETKDFLKMPKQKTGEGYFLAGFNNDKNGLEFINRHLPSSSIVLANGPSSKVLAVLTNQYLAYNPGSAYEKRFNWVFSAQNEDTGKADIVKDPKWAIDYIYLDNPSSENSHFKLHPELYEKIYKGNSEIYQIIR